MAYVQRWCWTIVLVFIYHTSSCFGSPIRPSNIDFNDFTSIVKNIHNGQTLSRFFEKAIPRLVIPSMDVSLYQDNFRSYINAVFRELNWDVKEDIMQYTPEDMPDNPYDWETTTRVEIWAKAPVPKQNSTHRLILATHYRSEATKNAENHQARAFVDGSLACAILVDLATSINKYLLENDISVSLEIGFLADPLPLTNHDPFGENPTLKYLLKKWTDEGDELEDNITLIWVDGIGFHNLYLPNTLPDKEGQTIFNMFASVEETLGRLGLLASNGNNNGYLFYNSYAIQGEIKSPLNNPFEGLPIAFFPLVAPPGLNLIHVGDYEMSSPFRLFDLSEVLKLVALCFLNNSRLGIVPDPPFLSGLKQSLFQNQEQQKRVESLMNFNYLPVSQGIHQSDVIPELNKQSVIDKGTQELEELQDNLHENRSNNNETDSRNLIAIFLAGFSFILVGVGVLFQRSRNSQNHSEKSSIKKERNTKCYYTIGYFLSFAAGASLVLLLAWYMLSQHVLPIQESIVQWEELLRQQHQVVSNISSVVEKFGVENDTLEKDSLEKLQIYSNSHSKYLWYKESTPENRPPEPLFPKIIHITMRNTFSPSEETLRYVHSWEELNPGYEIRLYDDNDMRDVIATYLNNELLETFDHLESAVEKADFWRYAIVYIFGGVYVDSDVSCVKPVNYWNELFIPQDLRGKFHANTSPDKAKPYLPEVIVGLEYITRSEDEKRFFPTRYQFTNWAFASVPGHPLFERVLNNIRQYVNKERMNGKHGDEYLGVLKRAGPGMLSLTINQWLEKHGWVTERVVEGYPIVGGVGFLEKDGFNFIGDRKMDKLDTHRVHILHHFYGSWKN